MNKKVQSYVILPLCNGRVKSTIGLFIGNQNVFLNNIEQLQNTEVIHKNGMENYKLTISEDKVKRFREICSQYGISFKRC